MRWPSGVWIQVPPKLEFRLGISIQILKTFQIFIKIWHPKQNARNLMKTCISRTFPWFLPDAHIALLPSAQFTPMEYSHIAVSWKVAYRSLSPCKTLQGILLAGSISLYLWRLPCQAATPTGPTGYSKGSSWPNPNCATGSTACAYWNYKSQKSFLSSIGLW